MRFNYLSFYFGLMSGFLLLTTGNTLNFWLAKDGSSTEIIGLFSLVSLPYAINFLWAPILDQMELSFLSFISENKRIRLLFVLHFFAAFMLFLMSLCDISDNYFEIAILSLFVSFFSSSQDIVLNALRTEIIPRHLTKKTSGIYIFGYRFGMILSGSVAIYLSSIISWQAIYFLFGFATILFPFGIYIFSLYIDTTKISALSKAKFSHNLSYIISSIGSFGFVILILIFLCLYRIADNFISVMLNPFLLSSGYVESQIAFAGKFCGIIGSAIGGIISYKFLEKYKISDCLLYFAALHALAHLGYISLEFVDSTSSNLLIVTLLESVTGGMTMAAYIALISSLCSGKFRATQYAVFTAMMGASRTILPSIAGKIAVILGWKLFFLISVFLVIPSLSILIFLKSEIDIKLDD